MVVHEGEKSLLKSLGYTCLVVMLVKHSIRDSINQYRDRVDIGTHTVRRRTALYRMFNIRPFISSIRFTLNSHSKHYIQDSTCCIQSCNLNRIESRLARTWVQSEFVWAILLPCCSSLVIPSHLFSLSLLFHRNCSSVNCLMPFLRCFFQQMHGGIVRLIRLSRCYSFTLF